MMIIENVGLVYLNVPIVFLKDFINAMLFNLTKRTCLATTEIYQHIFIDNSKFYVDIMLISTDLNYVDINKYFVDIDGCSVLQYKLKIGYQSIFINIDKFYIDIDEFLYPH